MSKAELERKYKKIKALYESQIEILDEYRSEIRKLKQEREKWEKELEAKTTNKSKCCHYWIKKGKSSEGYYLMQCKNCNDICKTTK